MDYSKINIVICLIIWFVAVVWTFSSRLTKKMTGTGLVFGYVLSLWTIHWFGPVLYLIPWYTLEWNIMWYRGFSPKWIEDGFRLSTYAIVAFSLGSVFLPNLLIRTLPFLRKDIPARIPNPRLPKAYIVGGLLFYFALAPTVGCIPTLKALTASGVNLILVGVCLTLWKATQEKKHGMFRRWLIGSLIGFPLLTLLSQGFLSFGAIALLVLFSFIASFFRPRWKLVLFGIFIWYLGLSFFVTYMRDRAEIRELVWRKEPVSKRADWLAGAMSNFEWLDLNNPQHLIRIDARLNQNLLVGAVVEHLAHNPHYAHGTSIRDAFLALIPRILWRNKPMRAGGNALISRYTDLPYEEFGPEDVGTTISVGQIMEFYINFGTGGVFVGYLCLGAIIGVLDAMARKHLVNGDWFGFAFWFLSGVGFLQVEVTLAEIFMRAGASALMALFVNNFLHGFRGIKISQRATFQ